jgi:zinc protease
LNDHSISLGFNSSRDDFSGSVKTLSKYQDIAFDLVALALTKPRFDADPIARMVESNLVRIRSNMTDPDWLNARLTNAILFEGHPYAMNSGGALSSLPKVTAKDLREKFNSQFARDNLIVSVAGDITKEQLSAVLDKVFGDLPSTSHLQTVRDVVLPTDSSETLYVQDIPQTVITMVSQGIKHDDPDYYVAQVLDFVLGGSGFGSRLTEEVREKRGLTYGIYSSFDEMDHAALLTIGASTKNESAQQVIDLTKEVMQGLSQTPIKAKELKDAQSYLVGSVPLQLTSTDRISSAVLGFQKLGLPPNYLDIRKEKLLAVTDLDVLRVAKRLLSPETMKIILVGKPKMGNTVKTVSSLPNVE